MDEASTSGGRTPKRATGRRDRVASRQQQAEGPIIALEEDEGVCAFHTTADAMTHRQHLRLAEEGELVDVRGRQLRFVGEGFEVESTPRRLRDIREEVRQRLQKVVQTGQPNTVKRIFSRFLENTAQVPFDVFAIRLATLLHPDPPEEIEDEDDFTPGGMGHRCAAAHHPECKT